MSGAGEGRPATRLVDGGRRGEWTQGIVNPPIWRASTILFDDVAALKRANATPDDQLYYGRRGTPTQWALAEALTALEPGAAGTTLHSSGAQAVATTLLALLGPGDEVLMVDSVYEPTRAFCDGMLARIGVKTRYYDPATNVDEVIALFGKRTRMLFLESPGSLTFEVQDVPALAAAARARGVLSAIDNTWATPLLFPAIAHCDASIVACTKYIVGHADAMLGSVTARAGTFERVRKTGQALGQCVSPDDAWLALRGLRTLGVRLRQHHEGGITVARWLAERPEVARVLHPALAGDPGHALWSRDFGGASGLFAIELADPDKARRGRWIDALRRFGIGFSWGGYESLALPIDPERTRTARPWDGAGAMVRIHIGLEDPEDLIADLDQAFAAV